MPMPVGCNREPTLGTAKNWYTCIIGLAQRFGTVRDLPTEKILDEGSRANLVSKIDQVCLKGQGGCDRHLALDYHIQSVGFHQSAMKNQVKTSPSRFKN